MQNSKIVSKTNFIMAKSCRKNVWIKLHQPEIFKQYPLSEFEMSIIETGNDIDILAQSLFPNGVEIKERNEFDTTLQHIEKKTAVIYQAVLKTDKFMMASDMLVFNKESNNYDIYEVKSSTASDEKKPRKENDYIEDLSFQKIIYESNNISIGRCYLITLNKTYMKSGDIDLDDLFYETDLTEEVNKKIGEVRDEMNEVYEYLNQEQEPEGYCSCIYKGKGTHCTTSPYSLKDLPEYPVHLISRIGNSEKKLKKFDRCKPFNIEYL